MGKICTCHPTKLKCREKGIPEFEVSGKFGKNSRNSVLDGKFPVGDWNMLFKDFEWCQSTVKSSSASDNTVFW